VQAFTRLDVKVLDGALRAYTLNEPVHGTTIQGKNREFKDVLAARSTLRVLVAAVLGRNLMQVIGMCIVPAFSVYRGRAVAGL
jgi:hypothetical protein